MSLTLNKPVNKLHALRPCSHCGVPTVAVEEDQDVFCCDGCLGAYQLIHNLGLEDYYALRANRSHIADDVPCIDPSRLSILDNLEAAGVVVHPMADGLCSVRLSVDGIHCAACTWLIERVQSTIPGLESAQVRMSDRSIEFIYDPNRTQPIKIAHKLAKLGYALSPWIVDTQEDQGFQLQQRDHWFGIALSAFFAANAMWVGVALYAGEATGISVDHEYFLRWVGTVLALLAVVFPGRLFFHTAWQAIRTGTPHVDIPVAIALMMGIGGSLIGSVRGVGDIYFDSLASLILLLRVGRYIQFRAQYRTSLSLGKLLRWNSNTACRLEADGSTTQLPAHRLQPGDRVVVLPGGIVPADGWVVAGVSSIDTSLLNGENRTQSVAIGDQVLAGTTNILAAVTLSVSSVGSETRIGKLMELVRSGASHRTRSIDAADQVSKWFVLAVILLGLGTWTTWTIVASAAVATEHTMALLTIACPCALALAAPLVLTVAMGRAARKQIWIRDGSCLERMATPGKLWIDKTGTLTFGKIKVLAWHGDDEGLQYAMALENSVRHPVAKAICDFARDRVAIGTEPSDVEFQVGKGVLGYVGRNSVAIGNQRWMSENGIAISGPLLAMERDALECNRSVVWLAVNGMACGLFELGDPLRPDAIETLRTISNLGWRLGILSGDRQEIVDHVANEIRSNGIDIEESLGQHCPEDKLKVIERTKAMENGPCAMVGDGVNDAAALSVADVGIAIRGGSEQALLAAPIFLANGRLASVAELMAASKGVTLGIRRCFAASLIYNTVTLTLAMLGWIHPLIAAVLMPISGLTVLVMAMSTNVFKKGK